MSRRQSRMSADTRQNDTLLEFENFKKKFLLANKHITKLNSTLSVRIEELNAQISTLYVENLRLRASEIALASQLKKEREKSRRILADAEAATHTLMKQLGHIRKSFQIPQRPSTPESPPSAPAPRAKRPVPDPNVSPPLGRIARPPGIPGIFEEEEEEQTEADELPPSPTPHRRKSKPRSSRLATQSSPPSVDQTPLPSFDEHLGKSGKRKPTRRQSGLLTTSMSITTLTPKGYTTEIIPPRPPSPAFGSPLRRDAAMEEEDDMMAEMQGRNGEENDSDDDPIALSVTRRDNRGRRVREKEAESDRGNERETGDEDGRAARPKRRVRDLEDGPSTYEGKKPKLKDVTNSPPPRPSLATLDAPHDRDRQRTPTEDTPRPSTSANVFAPRTFLTTPATATRQESHLPTPRSSSPLPQAPASESEQSAAGRERRVRKSVNYAEPKLNTKMRKPDPPPGASTSKRSSSASESRKSTGAAAPGASATTTSSSSTESATSQQPPQVAGVKRKKSRVYVPVDDNVESDGTQADAEYGGGAKTAAGSDWVNTDGRRRSVHTSAARRASAEELRRHSMAV